MPRWTTERFRSLVVALAMFLAAAPCPVLSADSPAQLRALIRDQLVYPRQARYVLPPRLPVENSTAAQNGEWMRVADALHAAGIIKTSIVGGKTVLEPAEQSTDAVVPSVNVRYETTSLNIVLGYWDVDVRGASRSGNVATVQGKRYMARRTRAYGVVLPVLLPERAATFADRDASWEVSEVGTTGSVREMPR